MWRYVLFLDDGGVISENQRRAAQWQRLVGGFFAPRLGGTPAAWADANRVVTGGMFAAAAFDRRLAAARDFRDFDEAYHRDWLGGMCALVGVPLPPDDAILDLAHAAASFVTSRVRSDYPGAVRAIRTLHARGYTLHTASGESSWELNGYLSAVEVRQCFGRLYGPDLVNTLKNAPAYYARIFAAAGVNPADALVVDDNPRAVAWAAEVGARTVLVGGASLPQGSSCLRVQSLAGLPGLLDELD